jgi:hypothetical protein
VSARLVTLAAGIAAAAALAPAGGAALSPAEQTWVTPLVKIWNIQNSSLKVVIAQALKPKALVAGSKPDNLNLTNTLAALINCKVPKDLIHSAGAPPTTRLKTFRNALNSACIHDQNGANDFARAIGAVTKGQSGKVTNFLKQGVAEFKKATGQLAKARSSLVSIGGQPLFQA